MITSLSSQDIFKCRINSSVDDIYHLKLGFNYPNIFEITNTTSVFQEKMIIEMKGNQLNKNDAVSIKLNTNELVSFNLMKNDCKDLIITYDDAPIPRGIINCNTLSTTLNFNIMETTLNSTINRYSIYYSNRYQESQSVTITGTQKTLNYTLTKEMNKFITLSSNSLIYRSIPFLKIQSISPKISLLGTRNITLMADLNLKDFGLLSFEISNGSISKEAIRVSNAFKSDVSSQISKIFNMSIYAIYKKTNERLLISDQIQIYYWSMILHF
jgi:hypothetical protein